MSTTANEDISTLMERVCATFRPEIAAVAPGACTAELAKRLKAQPKANWIKLCEEHARQRAAEVCEIHKDGDLLYRDGKYWSVLYSREFDDAVKMAGCSRRRRTYTDPAHLAFAEAVDLIRVRRLGPADLHYLIDPESLEWSPTVFEKCGAGDGE